MQNLDGDLSTLTQEQVEEWKSTVLSRVITTNDFSVMKHIVLFFFLMELSIVIIFGIPLLSAAIFGHSEYSSVFGFLFLLMSLMGGIVCINGYFLANNVKNQLPKEIRLERNELVVSQTCIPYDQCRWTDRTAFGIGSPFCYGLIQRGILFFTSPEYLREQSYVVVPLGTEEMELWRKKLGVSCKEVRPSYLRMFAFLVPLVCWGVPMLFGFALVRFSPAFKSLCFMAMIPGPIAGFIGLFNVLIPRDARTLSRTARYRFTERWGTFCAITVLVTVKK